jgi:hypothetical protein
VGDGDVRVWTIFVEPDSKSTAATWDREEESRRTAGRTYLRHQSLLHFYLRTNSFSNIGRKRTYTSQKDLPRGNSATSAGSSAAAAESPNR